MAVCSSTLQKLHINSFLAAAIVAIFFPLLSASEASACALRQSYSLVGQPLFPDLATF